jgi:large subunit ribosomal protein L22
MGRAYRYQRRLTHIVLAVAERPAAAGLVTKAEEPKPEVKAAKPKAEAPKAAKKKAAAPKPEAKAAGATKKKAAKQA